VAPFFWAVVGLLLVLSEFVAPGLVIIFFGLGALLNAGLTLLPTPLALSVPWQVGSWLALSALSFIFLRRRFSRIFRGEGAQTDEREFLGQTAEVIESIGPDHPGRIHFAGSSWKALAFDEDFVPGAPVTIIKKEGLTLYVTASIGKPTLPEGE